MKDNKDDITKTPNDSAEEIAQTEIPRATAEEIAQKVMIKVLADEFNRLTQQHTRILALNRIFIERGIVSGKKCIRPGVWSVEEYNGAVERNDERCPVCYKTGEHVADWVVCREHNVCWEPEGPPGKASLPAEIESFHEVDRFYEPLSLTSLDNDGNDTGHLARRISYELIDAIMENPPSDEKIEKAREKEEWLRIRREEALRIDAQTAEVFWIHANGFDPYGVEPELPPECQCIGREYFARRPGGDIWVSFHDLPRATCEALWGPQFKRWEEECLRRDGELPVLYLRLPKKMTAKP